MEKHNEDLSQEENEKRSKRSKKYTLEELLEGCTGENPHEELITDIQGEELI